MQTRNFFGTLEFPFPEKHPNISLVVDQDQRSNVPTDPTFLRIRGPGKLHGRFAKLEH